MKQQLTILATMICFVAFVFQSCGEGKRYHIEGTTEEGDTSGVMYIRLYKDTAIVAQAEVKNHRFVFEGEIIEPMLVSVTNGSGHGGWLVMLDADRMTLTPDSEFANGGRLNSELVHFLEQADSLDGLDDLRQQTQGYRELTKLYWTRHNDDALGAYVASVSIYALGADFIDSLLQSAGERVKQNNIFRMVEKNVANAKRTAIGMPFTDITLRTTEGQTVKLSQYVGRGKYVIMDCWASWCPPCRRLIPKLKELYKKYQNCGLEIIGVATRDKISDTQTATLELQVPWTVLSDDGLSPTIRDIYGFEGIPYMVVFAPDGTIIARNPREEDIPTLTGIDK